MTSSSSRPTTYAQGLIRYRVVKGLLERARAAELVSPLEHQRPPAGPGQIGRGSQAVVAAADDDRIPVVRRERGHGLREAYAAEYLVDVDHRGQANGEAMERASRQSATITCRERW